MQTLPIQKTIGMGLWLEKAGWKERSGIWRWADSKVTGIQPDFVLTREGYLQSGDILISSWSGISVASKENRDYSWLRWFSEPLSMDGSALSFDWSADVPILLDEIYTNWYNITNVIVWILNNFFDEGFCVSWNQIGKQYEEGQSSSHTMSASEYETRLADTNF